MKYVGNHLTCPRGLLIDRHLFPKPLIIIDFLICKIRLGKIDRGKAWKMLGGQGKALRACANFKLMTLRGTVTF
jgi:hypothetical protein